MKKRIIIAMLFVVTNINCIDEVQMRELIITAELEQKSMQELKEIIKGRQAFSQLFANEAISYLLTDTNEDFSGQIKKENFIKKNLNNIKLNKQKVIPKLTPSKSTYDTSPMHHKTHDKKPSLMCDNPPLYTLILCMLGMLLRHLYL